MTDAKISDTTGKVIKKDLCYSIKIKALGQNVTMPMDTEMNAQLKNLLSLAVQNGCKWSVWDQDIKKYVPADKEHLPDV